jgi:CheY-like chemotaxis protein
VVDHDHKMLLHPFLDAPQNVIEKRSRMVSTLLLKTGPVVLLVEDDPGDQELVRRAFQKSSFEADLRIVSDGQEAMDYLLREGAFTDPESAPRPDVILLDLNMPILTGQEVLKRMAAAQDLRTIPVVVLTMWDEPVNMLKSFDFGFNWSFAISDIKISC